MQDIKNIPMNRLVVLSIIFVLIFSAFLTRLFYLQLLKGNIFKNRSEQNQTRNLRIPAYRSIIYDRNKEFKLTYNERSLVLTVIEANLPKENVERFELLERMGRILNMTPDAIESSIKEQFIDPYTPIVIDSSPSLSEIAQFAEKIDEFPGIFWENQPKRVYPFGKSGFHVVGYTGQLNKDEYEKLKNQKEYYLGAIMGKRGIERQYDSIIRGKSGILLRSVNVVGQVLQQDVSQEPIQGEHMVLTIDAKLQQKAYELVQELTGSVIITHVLTGEILALVSTPSVDPKVFDNTQESRVQFRELVLDPKQPFLNRAIQGRYPPASTFKLISTAAFLNAGVNPEKAIISTGSYAIGNRLFRDWKRTGHGRTDMKKAIAGSVNSYFYHHSQTVGRRAIFEMAREFGYTMPFQIDLPDANVGFLPNDIWFQKTHKRRWSNGDTANIAIGQGDVLATPLEINMVTATIANGGTIYKPYILKERLSIRDKQTIWKQVPIPLKTVNLPQESFQIIQEGMRCVVRNEGTASWLDRYKMLTVPIAAKSGTAQTGYLKDNGLFTAYGPYGKENLSNAIAVTVLLEHERTGTAVRILAELFNYYFDTLYPEKNPKNIRNAQ